MADTYVVVCAVGPGEDPDRPFRHYVLATRQVFRTWEEAEAYAATVNENRRPIVVGGDWSGLRF